MKPARSKSSEGEGIDAACSLATGGDERGARDKIRVRVTRGFDAPASNDLVPARGPYRAGSFGPHLHPVGCCGAAPGILRKKGGDDTSIPRRSGAFAGTGASGLLQRPPA